MLLEELYDTDTLNRFIGYAIQHDSMDILSFKELLKAYNAGRLSLPEISEQRPEVLCKTGEYRDDDSKLLRLSLIHISVLPPAVALPRFLLVPCIPASVLPKDSENTSTS